MGLLSTFGAASGRAFGLTRVGAAIKDAYFNLTTLLLPGNGTNGAQNNTFLDSSSNNFTITRNGNTTQGTFSPFSQSGWSNYFDGNGDFLSISGNTNFNSTGDFTMEAWAYITSASAYGGIISLSEAVGSAGGRIAILNTGFLEFAVDGAGGGSYTSTAVPLNQWFHVAMVRSGSSTNNCSAYLNGIRVGQFTSTAQVNAASNACVIGRYYANGTNQYWTTGYISNARYVVGSALYSGTSYTVPTLALTAVSNTQLLTCQSNRFIDNSSNAFAITRNGDVSVQAFSPFTPTAAYSAATNGGSGYFDGTGDYLTAPDNAAFSFGSGNFTVELWVYLNSSTSGASISFVAQGSAGFDTDSSWYFLRHSSDKLRFISTTDGGIPGITIVDSTNSFLPTTGQWYHLAAVRNGTTITLYVNGVSVGSGTNSTTFYDSTRAVGICSGSAGTDPINGYVSSLRIVKGTAVYTAGFTPPTSPLTNITNTSLLLNFTNAGITDATAKNVLETVGNAQISTTQSKFGGSSMYFDGTGDYIYANTTAANAALGSGDWTVEFWLYTAAGSTTYNLLDWRPTSTHGAYLTVYLDVGIPKVVANNTTIITGGSAIPGTTWTHVAVCRSGTSTKMFINGTQSGSTATDSTNYLGLANRPAIGGGAYDTGNTLNGYIDDLRVTKGYARYTANFTPPTAAFPVQ